MAGLDRIWIAWAYRGLAGCGGPSASLLMLPQNITKPLICSAYIDIRY